MARHRSVGGLCTQLTEERVRLLRHAGLRQHLVLLGYDPDAMAVELTALEEALTQAHHAAAKAERDSQAAGAQRRVAKEAARVALTEIQATLRMAGDPPAALVPLVRDVRATWHGRHQTADHLERCLRAVQSRWAEQGEALAAWHRTVAALGPLAARHVAELECARERCVAFDAAGAAVKQAQKIAEDRARRGLRLIRMRAEHALGLWVKAGMKG